MGGPPAASGPPQQSSFSGKPLTIAAAHQPQAEWPLFDLAGEKPGAEASPGGQGLFLLPLFKVARSASEEAAVTLLKAGVEDWTCFALLPAVSPFFLRRSRFSRTRRREALEG
jgi:hypothetical protein